MGRPFVEFAVDQPSRPGLPPQRQHTLPSAGELLSEGGYHAYLGCIPSWTVELHKTRGNASEAADALWAECEFLEEDETEEEQRGDVYRFRVLSSEAGTLFVSPVFERVKGGDAAALLAYSVAEAVAAAAANRRHIRAESFTVCLEVLYGVD